MATIPVIKLYESYARGKSPDLVISFNSNGNGAFVWTGTLPLDWPYRRLEFFSNGGQDPTFVICTLPGKFGNLQAKRDEIEFSCHMILLNGEVQPKESNHTTIGLSMWLTHDGYKALVTAGTIGAQPWVPNVGDQMPISLINEKWFDDNSPEEDLFDDNGHPGPLLEKAFIEKPRAGSVPPNPLPVPEFPEHSTLRVKLLRSTSRFNGSEFATLAFIFRPGNREDDEFIHFQLPVNPDPSSDPTIPANPGDEIPERFYLPLPALPPEPHPFPSEPPSRPFPSSYRLMQRPSNDWLNGDLDGQPIPPEWQISLESTDLEALWNESIERYRRALRSTRSVNRLTLLPRIKLGKPSGNPGGSTDPDYPFESNFNVRAQFLVRLANGVPSDTPSLTLDNLDIDPFWLEPLGAWNATLYFDLNNATPTVHPNPSISCSSIIEPLNGIDPVPFALAFGVSLQQGLAPAQKVRIGSLDIEFGGALQNTPGSTSPPLQQLWLLDLSPELKRVPHLAGNMTLPVLSVTPGGQDGLPASEYAPENYSPSVSSNELCMERRFTGSAPVIIPIADDQNSKTTYSLEINESSPDNYSQTVSLSLRVNSSTGSDSLSSGTPRVVVIDSDPFLVAEVTYPPLTGADNSNLVALWNTGNPEGPSWQLQAGAQPFTLTLPPQGIGEEMPKAFELQDKDAEPIVPLDFRFSPTATEVLLPSYTPQNFADAPWNLRRILGFPGQRDAGAGVVQLNFELLYGLSCSVNTPLLRLTEIFSLIGRISGRVPPPSFSTAKLSPADLKRIAQLYEQKRWGWSLYAELYSKRVALLEPRASGDNYGTTTGAAGASAALEVFSISQGVSCTFRGKADLFYSVDPNDIAAVDNDTFPDYQSLQRDSLKTALKGGVSWPFESPRIFHATVLNPNSSSAVLSGLSFSPVGGTGTVKAGFDKDLSTITSVTEVGRTSKVSVARLGRIGVFHNLARFVIEYERDTSVSAQFNNLQTAFSNRPVLRKVREFVELLEPVASLSTSNQAFPGGGCVRSIEFKQRIIPVSPAWGSNVGASGWKIPLWYEPASRQAPNAPPTYLYSRPNVVFNLAGADGADVECGILSVDKLFFYTDTSPDADSDPHNWPVVSGVDFLAVPLPAPNPAFPSDNVHEVPAFDPPIPFGLGSFTHQLDTGHGRVNIVNGRGNQPIGTKLSNVTLQRAPAQPSQQTQKDLQALHDFVRGDMFTHIRKDLDPKAAISTLADQVCNGAIALSDQINGQTEQLVGAAVSQELALLESWLKQANTEIDTFQDELRSQLMHVFNTAVPIDDARKTIIGLIHSEIISASTRMGGITTTANALAQFAGRILDQVNRLSSELGAFHDQLKQNLAQASFTVTQDSSQLESQVDTLKQLLAGPIDKTNALLAQIRTQVQTGAESWMPCASYIANFWERSLAQPIAAIQQVLTQADIVLTYANSGADEKIGDAATAVQTAVATASQSIDLLVFPAPNNTAETKFVTELQNAAALAQQIPAYVKGLPDVVDGMAEGWVKQATDTLTSVASANVDAIVSAIVSQLRDALFNLQQGPLADIEADVQTTARTVLNFLQGKVSCVADEVCTAVGDLKNVSTNLLEAARRTLEDALSRFAEYVAQALPPTDIKLPPGVSLPVLLNRAFGEVPAIPNLGFSLPDAAYFYAPSLPSVSLTPLLTKVKDLVPNLSPLSTMVPSFGLLDRALPVPNLPNFDLNNIFPDFAGLNLGNLFPALKMPAGSSDAVKITHGIDSSARTAWIQADIDLKTDSAVIFSAGPMALQIASPRFTSTVRAQAGTNGQVSKQASGAITGDWQLLIGGSPMITLRATALTFDNNGKLHVDVSPDRVELSQALSFIQQIIAQYTSPDSGFGIYPSATGIETRLSLPIPNTSLGTTGISNLTFNFLFGLDWSPAFELHAGFGLASPNAPFNLSVFILGGGGHLVATARYRPGQSLTCQVDMALDASAALAIALGPISGSVHVNLGMRFIFNSGQGDLSLGIFLIIGGEVSILSIVSASVLLRLDATYSNGAFTCRGLFSISIKICWCFTLSVSEEVSCTLGSGGGLALVEDPLLPWSPSAEIPFSLAAATSSVPSKTELDSYATLASYYLQLVN